MFPTAISHNLSRLALRDELLITALSLHPHKPPAPSLPFFATLSLKEIVLMWLPVAVIQAIDGEAPEAGDSPIKIGKRGQGGRRWRPPYQEIVFSPLQPRPSPPARHRTAMTAPRLCSSESTWTR